MSTIEKMFAFYLFASCLMAMWRIKVDRVYMGTCERQAADEYSKKVLQANHEAAKRESDFYRSELDKAKAIIATNHRKNFKKKKVPAHSKE